MPPCECLFDKATHDRCWKHQGNVSITCDATSLYCEVFTLKGPSSASSCLSFDYKAVALNGPFLYVLLQAQPSLPSVIHLLLVVGAGSPFRLTFSSSCANPTASTTSLQLPLPPEERWHYLALDIPALLSHHTPIHYTTPVFRGLQGVSFGGNVSIRGVYGSHHPLSSNDLPRVMHMPTPRGSSWAETFRWTWMPDVPVLAGALAIGWLGCEKQDAVGLHNDLNVEDASLRMSPADMATSPTWCSEAIMSAEAAPVAEIGVSPQVEAGGPPCLTLQRVLGPGHGGQRPLCVIAQHRILYPVGEVVVDEDIAAGSQSHALSHDCAITHMAMAPSGHWLATAQHGKMSVVRIWAAATLELMALLPAGEVSCLAFSASGQTLLVSATSLRRPFRPTVALWDCKAATEGRVVLCAQQSVEAAVCGAVIVPFHEDRFVVCCSGTLCFFRVKDGRVHKSYLSTTPGSARPEFLCLACESGSGEAEPFILAGAADGCVYRIACSTRSIVAAYRLHAAPIRAVDAQQGVCVTASDDSFVRVWPTDFRRNFAEAELDSGVLAVSMAADASVVFTGTASGEVGLLDLADHRFHTVARAHTAEITSMALRCDPVELATASRDGTVRIWDCNTGRQLFQVECSCFNTGDRGADGETPEGATVGALEYHPTASHLAMGFASGHVRVLGLDMGSVHAALRPHNTAAVDHLSFTRDGGWLISLSRYALCLHHTALDYQAVKIVPCPASGPTIAVAHGWTKEMIAVVGAEGPDEVTVYDVADFTAWQPLQTFHMEVAADEKISTLTFTRDDSALLVACQQSVHKVCLAPPQSQRLLISPQAMVRHLQTCLYGQWVVYAVERSVHVLELESGQTQTFVGHAAPICGLRTHLCQPLVVSVDTAGQVSMWQLACAPKPTDAFLRTEADRSL
eukprot:GGOE01020502.1.p1 GENE.GGOE01020502.1~~GGOE01020502.1.p1  ORF type:complete len:912 (+),score=128.85 GGOE01020502.1:57-2792(+)